MKLIVDLIATQKPVRYLTLTIDSTDTVMTLKAKIAQSASLSSDQVKFQNVSYNGRIFNEYEDINKPIIDYGLTDYSTVTLIPRMHATQLRIVGGYFAGF